jgi:hypothetical protein
MVIKALPCAIAGSACHCGTRSFHHENGSEAPEALAYHRATWHAARMQGSKRPPRAGGAAIALLALGGVIVGNHYGQASIGLIAGLAAGGAIALATWLIDRNRG